MLEKYISNGQKRFSSLSKIQRDIVMKGYFKGLPKRSRRLLGIFLSFVIILIVRLYSLTIEQRYATIDGYYAPLTINFNRDNRFSLFDISLMSSLESIAFPEYSVRSLYPQAYIKLSLKSKEKQCYVWRLKLRKPFSDTYLSSIDDFKRLTPFHTNYPIPTDYQFYDIPNNQNLILALSNSRYVYLIQIKC